MTQRFIDFDAFMQEAKEEPVIIRIFGEDEELPASMPADVVLSIIRMNSNPNKALSDEEVFNMAIRIFGDKLDKWCAKGLTVDQLEVLITKVMGIYTSKRHMPQNKNKGKGKGKGNKTPR